MESVSSATAGPAGSKASLAAVDPLDLETDLLFELLGEVVVEQEGAELWRAVRALSR